MFMNFLFWAKLVYLLLYFKETEEITHAESHATRKIVWAVKSIKGCRPGG
jgi:hypothetical protein